MKKIQKPISGSNFNGNTLSNAHFNEVDVSFRFCELLAIRILPQKNVKDQNFPLFFTFTLQSKFFLT